MKKDMMTMLLKKATGYTAKESVEEYVVEEGKKRLVKQKISKKHMPADTAALKIYLELESGKELCNMSDEELLREKQRLLAEIRESK